MLLSISQPLKTFHDLCTINQTRITMLNFFVTKADVWQQIWREVDPIQSPHHCLQPLKMIPLMMKMKMEIEKDRI